MKVFSKSAALVASCSFLVACGSNTGPSERVRDFTSFNNLPVAGTTRIKGDGATTTYLVLSDSVSIGGPVSATDAETLVTTEFGRIIRIEAMAGGAEFSWDASRGDTSENIGEFTVFTTADGESQAIFSNPSVAGYNYQTYGTWASVPETSQTVAAISAGAKTSSSDVPNTSASYTGTSSGLAITSDGRALSTTSDIALETDFETIDITSSGTQAADFTSVLTDSNQDFNDAPAAAFDAPEWDFTGTGDVTGNTFNATVQTDDTLSAQGTADGSFFGPVAVEAGGLFSLTNDAGAGIVGSFGARR